MNGEPEQGMDEAMLSQMQRPSLAKRARTISGLSQAEFSRVYGIPLGTIRDWEQGRTAPDAAAIAYLTAIANDAEAASKVYRSNASISNGI
jgi:putative transcriptional regulator